MNTNYYEKYISNRKSLIRILCRTKQWSGLDESDVFKWLDNFKDTFGKYIAIKLLIHSVYYSEKNIISLLGYGVKELILSQIIKRRLIDNDSILLPRSETNALLKQMLLDSAFIPLLDKKKPGESGNQMTRYLIQKLDISPTQTFFIDDLLEEDIKKLSTMIFIDDCIGSGHQYMTFFNRDTVKSKIEISKRNNIPVYYLTLTGYKKNIETCRNLSGMEDIEIVVCDELDDIDRVFNRNNIIWYDNEEFDDAHQYFTFLEKECGVGKYGYSSLDFSVFMHNNIPDWSLPIYWMKNADWVPLMKRKNSNLF